MGRSFRSKVATVTVIITDGAEAEGIITVGVITITATGDWLRDSAEVVPIGRPLLISSQG
jgi:hypothetical protein